MNKIVSALIFIAILLFGVSAKSAEFKFLKESLIYKEPIAAPRAAKTGFTLDTSKYLGQRVAYMEGVIGRSVPLITFIHGSLKLQTGLEAATWMTLGYNDGAFPLLTQDFLIAAPLMIRYNKFSGAIKFNHISAHLGDGFSDMIKENLSDRELREFEQKESMADDYGLGLTLIEPFNYSRDFMSAHLSYEYVLEGFNVRQYIHGGYVHKMIPENLGRLFVGNGIEIEKEFRIASPYYAQDITLNTDVHSVDYSGQLGFTLLKSSDNLFNLRFAMTGYYGSDRRGQFLGKKLHQLGIGFFIE